MQRGTLLAFGEVMLRLSPARGELLLQSPRLDVWVAGAEANVVTQLAHLGDAAALATRLPDDDLGRAALATLRGHGVDVSRIPLGGERIGLYFVTPGAGVRATDVIYDRAGSAFADAPADAWDWDALLAGVDRLHLSGITPALGPVAARHAIVAAEAAGARGVAVSFDGNWRGKLWARWDGDPRAILARIVDQADLLFGDHRDVALLLGRSPFEGDGRERFDAAAEAAFEAFPRLRIIATTSRETVHAGHHRLGGRIVTRDERADAEAVEVPDVVDRIGSGDAFVAGVLHGLRGEGTVAAALHDGLALAALKHSLAGDASVFSQDHLSAWRGGHRDVRR